MRKTIKTAFALALAGLFLAGLSGCWGERKTAGADRDPGGGGGGNGEQQPPDGDRERQSEREAAAAAENLQRIEAGRAKAESVPIKCSVCHGTKGEGIESSGLLLAGKPAHCLAAALEAYKSGERNAGPALSMAPNATNLSDEDIANLAAYFSSLPSPENPGNTSNPYPPCQ